MKRIVTLVVVALVMAAMMVAMAVPAFGAAGGATANCGPPGQTHSEVAKFPGSTPEAWGGPPGKNDDSTGVSQECAPGRLK